MARETDQERRRRLQSGSRSLSAPGSASGGDAAPATAEAAIPASLALPGLAPLPVPVVPLTPAMPPRLALPAEPAATPPQAPTLPAANWVPPSAAALVQALLSQSRAGNQGFYLVIVPEDAAPRIEQLADCQQLVARIVALVGTDVSLFPFIGWPLRITRGMPRYLVTPYGALPLFSPPSPEDLEPEPDGFVGASRPSMSPAAEFPDAPGEADEVDDQALPAARGAPLASADDNAGDDSPVFPPG